MPDVASVLKSEISRIARREIKSEIVALKKAVTLCRGEIATLKRRSQSLEQQLRRVGKDAGRVATESDGEVSSVTHRFSARRLTAHRRRLELSATDFGRLLGVSAQSVYNWEQGKSRPLAKHMPAIAALRTLGRTRAAAHLESLRAGD